MPKKKAKVNKDPKAKSAAVIKHELELKISNIKKRLGEMRQYKQILQQDGLTPDAEDKRIESELIVKLLRLEKQLSPPTKRPGKRPQKAKKAPPPRRPGPRNKQKPKVKR